MELRRSQNRARISKRIPLSNVTNAQSLSSSSSSAFPLNPRLKVSDPGSSISSFSNLDTISIKASPKLQSSAPKNSISGRICNCNRPVKENTTNLGAINVYNSKHSVVYTRCGTDGRKGKDIAAAMAFPPRQRNRTTGGKMKAENRDAAVLGASSVPYKKSKKIQQHMDMDDVIVEASSAAQDYIEKQRAYFAEIDAYNLDEEVVSESELV